MPNWVYTSITIKGKQEDLVSFMDKVKGSDKFETEGREFDFNSFIPQPDNIFRENLSTDKEKELAEQGIPNWYRWNSDNWNTKWNAVDAEFQIESIDQGELYLAFNTAWDFPYPVVYKMIEEHTELDFTITCEEESMAFMGILETESGEIVRDIFEEPLTVDEEDNPVYWDVTTNVWRYDATNQELPDSEDFWPTYKTPWE